MSYQYILFGFDGLKSLLDFSYSIFLARVP